MMTIFNELPIVFRVIMMNQGFVCSGSIVEGIIPYETISVKKFLSNRFSMFLHGVRCLGTHLAQTFL